MSCVSRSFRLNPLSICQYLEFLYRSEIKFYGCQILYLQTVFSSDLFKLLGFNTLRTIGSMKFNRLENQSLRRRRWTRCI